VEIVKKALCMLLFFIIFFGKEVKCFPLKYQMINDDKVVEYVHKVNYDKVVFLTFDDGPSYLSTNKIIDILDKKDVKASFFIVGENVKNNKYRFTEMYCHDMDVFPHCYSHVYKKIYKNENEYLKDLEKSMSITEALRSSSSKKFVRFPGGSYNSYCKKDTSTNIKNNLKKLNINYIDWNVSSGDAASALAPKEDLIKNIRSMGDAYRISVVLMHDGDNKTTTVDALPEIIDYYKDRGYRFKKLSEMTIEEYDYLENIKVMNKS
jgi:peptidoglycan/xylan/chitin deacetylase (PgdA/CDA1 family)